MIHILQLQAIDRLPHPHYHLYLFLSLSLPLFILSIYLMYCTFVVLWEIFAFLIIMVIMLMMMMMTVESIWCEGHTLRHTHTHFAIINYEQVSSSGVYILTQTDENNVKRRERERDQYIIWSTLSSFLYKFHRKKKSQTLSFTGTTMIIQYK